MKIASNERVVIFGTTQSGKSTLFRYLVRLYKRVIVYDPMHQHNALGRIVHNPDLLLAAFREHNKVVFQPNEDTLANFEQVCKLCLGLSNFLFAVEEAHYYARKTFLPPKFGQLLKTGANRGIGVVAISQRPAELHNTVISLAAHRVSFILDMQSDIEVLHDYFGELALKLPQLPPYFFIHKKIREPTIVHAPIKLSSR